MQHGANSDTPTVRGETALHLAARANQTDIIRILLRNGAQVDARAREQQVSQRKINRLQIHLDYKGEGVGEVILVELCELSEQNAI